MMPSTSSSTYTTDRVWLPSPATVIGLFDRACVANAGIARPSFGRIRGP